MKQNNIWAFHWDKQFHIRTQDDEFSSLLTFDLFQEFLTICKNLSDEDVKIAFEKFDTSGDNKLDYREFCMMINNRAEQDV